MGPRKRRLYALAEHVFSNRVLVIETNSSQYLASMIADDVNIS